MSSKVRVYELSRESGLPTKEVLRRLSELGIDAKSHSSSITEEDAQRFRDSLGRSQAEREAAERERQRREQEELERLKQLKLTEVAPPEQRKAAKVLPPHLRQQQEAQAPPAPAAPPAEEPAPPGAPATRPPAETPPPPAASAPTPPQAPAPPRPGGVRMPGAPPPPTVTGAPPRPRRVLEPKLPQEGTGKRTIPPPIRPAPAQRPAAARQQPPAARQQPPGRRPGGPRRTESPYRQPVTRTGPPPAAPPPPGAPPGRGAPPKKRKKKEHERPTPEEHAIDLRPQRRDVPLEELIKVDRVEVTSGITVGELADKLGVPGPALVKKLFEMGEMATVQQTLPDDTVEILCAELGVEVRFLSEEELEFGVEEPDDPADLEPRPPVVTVMGHVDHGKTLLLDAIRETNVVATEAGGITQHIGAYQAWHDGRPITFIDTPGHEAFTAMRARGAQVTDIVVLVVAANEGVMPQTVEAIDHAKAAGVPIVVALNKMDLDGADPDRVKAQLTEHGLVPEDFGGDVPVVPVSAKTKMGLDDLLEIILLQAELLDLKANPNKPARGRVLEAHLDRGRGPVATLLVQAGTLRPGDALVAGTADGRVRVMFDEHGRELEEARPGTPVLVVGLNDVPEAGDEFRVVANERIARDIAERRAERQRRAELAEHARPRTLEELTREVEAGERTTLNIIIKADVAGSAEALEDALSKLELEEVSVRVIHAGVGAITENDVRLAEASDAIIVGFNVRPDANARAAIERSGVDVRTYRIIYEAIEDIERAVKGLVAPEEQEVELGAAEVREIFRIPRVGFVFGCYVTEGVVRRGAQVRVVREGVVVAEDRVASLRRFKEDVREVSAGYECGVGLENFQDVKVGDVLEIFEVREVAPTG